MKNSLIIFIFFAFQTQAQKQIFATLSIGTIRHETSTTSLNQRIKGKPAYDFLPEIKFDISFKNNSFIEFGFQNPSLSTKFEINQNSQWDESSAEERIILQKSGYFKIFLAYKYKISLTKRVHFLFFIGPSLNINRFVGNDYYNSTFNSLPNPQGFNVDYYYKYDVYKTKRLTLASLFGCELRSDIGKRTIFVLRFSYNKGFESFNETKIESYIFNNLNDKGTIFYNGSGFSTTFGLGFNLNYYKTNKRLQESNSF